MTGKRHHLLATGNMAGSSHTLHKFPSILARITNDSYYSHAADEKAEAKTGSIANSRSQS